MKAKEYAAKFEQGEDVGAIGYAFLTEVTEIAKSRNARTDAALFSIFDEQDRKWRAFARLVEGVKSEGFEIVLRRMMPEIYEKWITKARRGAAKMDLKKCEK